MRFLKPRKSRMHNAGVPRLLRGNQYLLEIHKLKRTIPNWVSLLTCADEEQRLEQMIRVNIVGSYLTDKYAWAIPDSRALRILESFAPLVEVGCGKGYWCRLLHDRGVDILGVDKLGPLRDSWTFTAKGGPSILRRSAMRHRNLFLCYPDEDSNVGNMCLEYFEGEYIIHVGELLATGTHCGYPQAPFGRTTGADFQVALAENFHCILRAKLPSFPISNDYLTVWKRTVFIEGREHSEDNEDLWASIPPAEVLDNEAAAPAWNHLLVPEDAN